ncbi:hypothetical protein D7X25_05870 [bacterium 1XD42-8]|nr:hypothetical protein D7X25_05870 [bacterium 1XD42-8]
MTFLQPPLLQPGIMAVCARRAFSTYLNMAIICTGKAVLEQFRKRFGEIKKSRAFSIPGRLR